MTTHGEEMLENLFMTCLMGIFNVKLKVKFIYF
jgi:hypothetical protein